jgi:hypothetical protein
MQMMLTVQHMGVEVGRVAVTYSLLSTTLTGLLNPLIYGTFSKSYRQGYTQLIVAASKLLFGCPITSDDVLAGSALRPRLMNHLDFGLFQISQHRGSGQAMQR